VLWQNSKDCPGIYLDYYEPLPNVNFVTSIKPGVKIDYIGNYWHPDFNPYLADGKLGFYDKLKLKSYMENIVSDKINKLGKNYISVHIRRTDHVILAKSKSKYTTDDDFIEFIDKHDSNSNIYIATDNLETYNKFKKLYPDRIKFDYHKEENKNVKKCERTTSLQDAIIDLHMCISSVEFKGSGFSSFSGLISCVRKSQS